MADKIKLSALGPVSEQAVKYYKIGDTVVTFYGSLSFEKILLMIQETINFIVDDRNFISAPLKRIISDIILAKHCTNLDFDWLDSPNLSASILYENYDILWHHGVFDTIKENFDPKLYSFFQETLKETLDNIIGYRNSAAGIIDTLSAQAGFNAHTIEQALNDMGDDEKMGKVKELFKMAETLQKAE